MRRAAFGALAAVMMLAMSAPARAADWVLVGTAPNGTRSFIDPDGMRRQGNVVRAWIMIDYAEPRYTELVKGNNPYSSILTLQDFDCARREHLGIEEQRFYSDHMAQGTVIYQIRFSAEQRATLPHAIVPGSINELWFKRSCAR